MNNNNKIYFSIDEMNDAVININNKILSSNWSPDVILSINRGGCVPGVYLSHLLNTSHEVINVNNKIENLSINNRNVLVIDDINDTGKTLEIISKMFFDSQNSVKYAVMVNNVSSKFKVDFYGKNIDKKIDNSWIVFPWEEIR